MKKIIYTGVLIGVIFSMVQSSQAVNVCKVRHMADEGIICLERGSCEPIDRFLLRAAKGCRVKAPGQFMPITRLAFVDIFSHLLRLDREFPQGWKDLTDEIRYKLGVKALKEKGIGVFNDKAPAGSLTREELASVLQTATIKKDLGFSTGLPGQRFDLKNDGFVIYDLKLYVDEGNGFKLWERRKNLKESTAGSRDYTAKLDSYNNAMVTFGDNINGKIPVIGSRLKLSYKIFGKKSEIVTECEVAMLLSDSALARSLKNAYNPSPILTKANFADLLIRVMGLGKQLPKDSAHLGEEDLYLLETKLLSRKGVNIFTGSRPEDLLKREELARFLYDSPVEEVLGLSNGKKNQAFELNNAGFVIYDLHVYVKENNGYEEWNKKDSFVESSSANKDYIVKLDAGNYGTIYFGSGRKGKIPISNSPVKVRYRLYAPVTMLTEDDIICVLKGKPVAETYIPPPHPPDFPPPTDGFHDPATPY